MLPHSSRHLITAGLLLAGLSGCQTNQQFLAENQAAAIQTTLSRAKFELNCETAEATVLSSKVAQPLVGWGVERTEYTIGVSGCGKRAVYLSWCLNTETCNAINDSSAPLSSQ